jgi:hypothetical protein
MYFEQACKEFKAGQVAKHFADWTKITSDREILSNISGVGIEVIDMPTQHSFNVQKFQPHEYPILDGEISKLLSKGVITKAASAEPGQIVSSIFLHPKKDGSYRLILNLKQFNTNVVYHHFKMDSIQTIVQLVTPNCFMASLDLKDAYYSLPIRAGDRKFLRFIWRDELYEFTCLPNGLACAPRQFTKTLKPVLATLHKMGHISVAHIDDCYLQSQTYEQCVGNVIDTILLLDSLGWVVHPLKSILIPAQEIITLGFVINSVSMTIRLTVEKASDLKKSCERLLNSSKPLTIRAVAAVIGKIVASFPGVMYGPLYYRDLEAVKSNALKMAKGEFDTPMSLSPLATQELQWWVSNVETAHKRLSHDKPLHQITTDASLLGWGAECNGISSGGTWTKLEATNHINYLEMLAILFGLQTFAKDKENTHIRIRCDNTTAVNIIKNMGTSHSEKCNKLAKAIWEWCISRSIWISLAHIPGKLNFVADFESRRNQRESEWMLDKSVLSNALERLEFEPEIDLFASRVNTQFQKYVSYRPDPNAFAVDAFTLNWGELKFYAFPPFSLIAHVLSKIQNDRGEGICVLPDWSTQSWYAKAFQMMKKQPIHLKASRELLRLPSQPNEQHPIWNKVNLLVCLLSGRV